MRRLVVPSAIVVALTLIIASFNWGRFAERQAQRVSNIRAEGYATPTGAKQSRLSLDEPDQSDHVLIANAATVSFGLLWDVMRAAASNKRAEWARELEQLPSGPRRNAAIKSFYKIWVELTPSAATQAVETIQDKRARSMAFAAIADAAADSALPQIADLEFRLGYRSSQWNATSVLARWAATDPQAVANFLQEHPDNDPGHFLDVTYSWANSDPEKAAEWFANLKLPPLHNPKYPRQEDRRRLDAVRGLFQAWLEKDTHAAAAYAATHADDPDVKKALGEFGESLFIKSKEEATAFIQSLPNEDAQRAALEDILGHVGARVITMREGGDDEEPPPPEINRDEIPPWLVTLPVKLWFDHVGEIFRDWNQSDSANAEAWLCALPSDAKMKAIADYSGAASAEQAARVFELTALIADANTRRVALQKFVDNLSDNASEAREKITALSITNQQKQALLQLVRKRQ